MVEKLPAKNFEIAFLVCDDTVFAEGWSRGPLFLGGGKCWRGGGTLTCTRARSLGRLGPQGSIAPEGQKGPVGQVRIFSMCHHVCIHVRHNIYVDMFTLLRHHVCIHLHHNVHGECITFVFIGICVSRLTSVCIHIDWHQYVFIYIFVSVCLSTSTSVGITLVTHMAQNV